MQKHDQDCGCSNYYSVTHNVWNNCVLLISLALKQSTIILMVFSVRFMYYIAVF
jgi:hypothetical protein